MEPEGPQLPAVGINALDNVCLVPHSRTDIVSEGNVVCKNVHVGTALKRAGYILPQRPDRQKITLNPGDEAPFSSWRTQANICTAGEVAAMRTSQRYQN